MNKLFPRVVGRASKSLVSMLPTVVFVLLALFLGVATSGWAQQSEVQISAYIKQLDASDEKKRSQAIAALVAMGPTAVPQLIAAFKDPSVRFDALEVLNQIKPVAIDALKQALRDPHEGVRIGAAHALGHLRAYAQSAVPDLIAALKDNKESVRRDAANALAQVVGPGSGAVVNDLVAALKDPDDVTRAFAAVALGRIGAAASAASVALIEVLKEDNKLAINAAGALGQIGGDTRATVPALIELES